MKRIASESRKPGMQSARQCRECGAPLAIDDGERCPACAPRLSENARTIGEEMRRRREEMASAEREINNLGLLIHRLNRRVNE